jgi:hypothetical protein
MKSETESDDIYHESHEPKKLKEDTTSSERHIISSLLVLLHVIVQTHVLIVSASDIGLALGGKGGHDNSWINESSRYQHHKFRPNGTCRGSLKKKMN